MRNHKVRSWGVAPLAIAGTAALGVAPAVTPALAAGVKTVVAEAALLDTQSWIMGGSGLPIPPPQYLDLLSERYVNPGAFPEFSGTTLPFTTANGVHQPVFDVSPANMNPLFTPEGLYPLTGVKTLELDPSLQQGVTILDSTIKQQIAAGHNVVAVGYSQSATINSLEMSNLLALPQAEQPTADQLSFVLLGDPSNPDGGLLSRFDVPGAPLSIPAVGITFSGATPADTPWDTAVYTQEYDGFADFPKYPINLLSDINAFLGIMFVHGTYPTISADKVASAIALPVSDDYTGHTQYFMIPTETLPLLSPLLSIPVIGQPLYNLLEPDMRILVNLGYGNIENGWDPGPANLPTPFGVFPDLNPADVFTALSNGAQQGFQDFLQSFGSMSAQSIWDGFAPTGGEAAFALPSLTDVVNTLSSVASTGYATLLPTADIINFLTTTVPAYDVSLFVQGLTSGNLLDAFGMPIAADIGLTTMAVGFEFEVITNALSSISAEFSDLFSA